MKPTQRVFVLLVCMLMLSGCEVMVASAQGKKCPDERVKPNGECCPEGTRTDGPAGMQCIPVEKKAEEAPKKKVEAPKVKKREKKVSRPKQGYLRGECFPNGTCMGGLICEDDECVKESAWERPAATTAPAGYAKIPAGSFTMGSPRGEEGRDDDEGQVNVRLSRGFYLKKTEVTQGEWKALMGSNPSSFSSCGDSCPVERVSWEDGLEYMNKLSEREGIEKCYEKRGEEWRWSKGLDCKGYRYPTEAEWEYAARGGTTVARYGSLGSIAWYDENSGRKTHPVGKKEANGYGLYDMLGNVWEWTWDGYSEDLPGGVDPVSGGLVQSGSANRVNRGCSWGGLYARWCRAARRGGSSPGRRLITLGLRPARSSH